MNGWDGHRRGLRLVIGAQRDCDPLPTCSAHFTPAVAAAATVKAPDLRQVQSTSTSSLLKQALTGFQNNVTFFCEFPISSYNPPPFFFCISVSRKHGWRTFKSWQHLACEACGCPTKIPCLKGLQRKTDAHIHAEDFTRSPSEIPIAQNTNKEKEGTQSGGVNFPVKHPRNIHGKFDFLFVLLLTYWFIYLFLPTCLFICEFQFTVPPPFRKNNRMY